MVEAFMHLRVDVVCCRCPLGSHWSHHSHSSHRFVLSGLIVRLVLIVLIVRIVLIVLYSSLRFLLGLIVCFVL